ncbi:peptidase inhibitor family I36 protein [Streptomyces torulosus]|uniref:peptidase inhibitor family I36 protein n=1 Tax=Streptomyces torulosus TaxID=68276 RepID=UPI0006EBB9CD|nr:peptidase inhibitor family I36 protein [Streptomyces torulosus]
MKKRKHMIGAMAASVALAITALATAGSAAGAAPYPHCPGGKVCMWSEPHFQGARYDWSPDEGNVFLGKHGLADKVASFVATVDGCFQDSPPPGPGQWRKFRPNDWSADYAFGRQVDRIKPGC